MSVRCNNPQSGKSPSGSAALKRRRATSSTRNCGPKPQAVIDKAIAVPLRLNASSPLASENRQTVSVKADSPQPAAAMPAMTREAVTTMNTGLVCLILHSARAWRSLSSCTTESARALPAACAMAPFSIVSLTNSASARVSRSWELIASSARRRQRSYREMFTPCASASTGATVAAATQKSGSHFTSTECAA